MLIKDWILFILCVSTLLFQIVTCKKEEAIYTNKWRLWYLLPTFLCLLHALILGVELCLGGIYLGCLIAVIGYFINKESVRKYASLTALIFCLISVPICFLYGGYRLPNFVKGFQDGFTDMRQHYSLTLHKNIDWDNLYEEYLPKFEAAELAHDEVANSIAWIEFTNEFCDGHTSYIPLGDVEEMAQMVLESVCGNDYGFSLMCLSGGDHVAILVEEGSLAYEAGIRTGTVITHFDDIPVDELRPAAREIMLQCMLVTNEENRHFFESFFIPGTLGEEVTVTFLDENNAAVTTTLSSLGSYSTRLNSALDFVTYRTPNANMSVSQIDESCILLNINMMEFNSEVRETSNYDAVPSTLREELIAAREGGTSNLIIDLRGNAGGSSLMAQAIVALIAPEGQQYWASDGYYNEETNSYDVLKDYMFTGENLWEGGEIAVLVDSGSNSATNHLMASIQTLPNVTVYGITEAAGAAQGVGGIRLSSGLLSYSLTTVLDENGSIWIDCDESRNARLLVDERIPLTLDALEIIFSEGEDYALQYVIDAMKN